MQSIDNISSKHNNDNDIVIQDSKHAKQYENLDDILQDEHMADYCITSDIIYICDNSKDIPQCDIEKADGDKCIRCWKILPEVAKNVEKCCQRCLDAVAAM